MKYFYILRELNNIKKRKHKSTLIKSEKSGFDDGFQFIEFRGIIPVFMRT